MKKWLCAVLLLAGCSHTVSEDDLPQAHVIVGGKTYDTSIGTYCWDELCVDKINPDEQLQHADPIIVSSGESFSVQLEGDEPPTTIDVSLVNGNDVQIVPLQHGQMTAPIEQGRYTYNYRASWLDGNVSYGDISYVFVIEVQ